MIKERKYSKSNPANAKFHLPLINIKNVIKNYIQSQPEIYKYYNFSYKSQVHDLDLILDEYIKRVKYSSTYRSSIYLPKSTFNKIYLDLHKKRSILKNTYMGLLRLYFKKGSNRKLLYRHTDTTCIVNKNGSTKVKYNGL